MKSNTFILLASVAVLPFAVNAKDHHTGAHEQVSDSVIAKQRQALANSTQGKGFGPQSPRNIDSAKGVNTLMFNASPEANEMNLCNIHFHKNAEHAGGEFSEYAGNGNGHGYLSGYKYTGSLTKAETKAVEQDICPSEHGKLFSGDTIEIHYVHTTAKAKPGATLNSCFTEADKNPQLRVEAQVYVLVNDSSALDFEKITKVEQKGGLYQAINMPQGLGDSVQYAGSTTGPDYNEVGSPFQVTWGVKPKVAKVNIDTVGNWCKGNEFKENHAHGVRNLVTNPDLLSTIK